MTLIKLPAPGQDCVQPVYMMNQRATDTDMYKLHDDSIRKAARVRDMCSASAAGILLIYKPTIRADPSLSCNFSAAIVCDDIPERLKCSPKKDASPS